MACGEQEQQQIINANDGPHQTRTSLFLTPSSHLLKSELKQDSSAYHTRANSHDINDENVDPTTLAITPRGEATLGVEMTISGAVERLGAQSTSGSASKLARFADGAMDMMDGDRSDGSAEGAGLAHDRDVGRNKEKAGMGEHQKKAKKQDGKK